MSDARDGDILAPEPTGGVDTLFNNRVNAIPLDPGQVMDSEIPGLRDQLKRLSDNLHPDDYRAFNAGVKQIRQRENMLWSARQRSLAVEKQQVKEQQDAVAAEWKNKIQPGSPNNPSYDMIEQDDRLKQPGWDKVKDDIYAKLTRSGEIDPASPVDKANQVDILKKMNLDWGDPEKITTQKQIDQRFYNRDITARTYENLSQQLQLRRTVEGQKIDPAIKELTKAKEGLIFGLNALTPDLRALDAMNAARNGAESANDRMVRFHHDLMAKISNYLDNKKDPSVLFDPSNKVEYFGNPENMKKYQAPINQKPLPPQTAPQENKKLEDMTDQELQQFGRGANARMRALAIQEAVKRGLIQAPVTVPGAPLN